MSSNRTTPQTPSTTNAPASVDALRTLQGFLTGTRAYLHFNEDNFDSDADKVTYAASFLKGDALAWFEPTLRDYLDHDEEENRKAETNRIFDDYDNFEECHGARRP
ncbi:hypothetical protein MCOR14_006232 [Pyricularia oryzae]|nr:hypothetical protein MCOR14_006232 [Pyricularia oryzae]